MITTHQWEPFIVQLTWGWSDEGRVTVFGISVIGPRQLTTVEWRKVPWQRFRESHRYAVYEALKGEA